MLWHSSVCRRSVSAVAALLVPTTKAHFNFNDTALNDREHANVLPRRPEDPGGRCSASVESCGKATTEADSQPFLWTEPLLSVSALRTATSIDSIHRPVPTSPSLCRAALRANAQSHAVRGKQQRAEYDVSMMRKKFLRVRQHRVLPSKRRQTCDSEHLRFRAVRHSDFVGNAGNVVVRHARNLQQDLHSLDGRQ